MCQGRSFGDPPFFVLLVAIAASAAFQGLRIQMVSNGAADALKRADGMEPGLDGQRSEAPEPANEFAQRDLSAEAARFIKKR